MIKLGNMEEHENGIRGSKKLFLFMRHSIKLKKYINNNIKLLLKWSQAQIKFQGI